jgi:hypothetical protein
VKHRLIIYISLFFATLASRFPFLFDGYGSEDDSWGLVLNARLMAETGEYSFSRLPGHPVQEFILAVMPDAGPFVMNLLSAIFTSIAIVVFADCLRMLKIKAYLAWAVLLSFIPIIYLSGVYTIDYNWGLAFILIAWNLFIRDKLVLCGLFLGLAIGCRVTSGAVLLGFITMLYTSEKFQLKQLIVLSLSTVFVGLLCYTPSFYTYGISFFDTYRLPYPSIPKVIVKGSIGVWGFTGLFALIYIKLKFVKRQGLAFNSPLFKGSFVIILLYTIAFIVLPQKSSFFIPAIPFVIYLASTVQLKKTEFAIIGILFFLTPFTFGLNLNDSNRGSSYSQLAITANVSGQEVFFDPLTGTMQIEQERRINRQKYIDKSLIAYNKIESKSALLCGWWMNQFLENVHQKGANSQVVLVEFADSNQLDSLLQLDYSLFYLIDIDKINDERYSMNKTASVSKLLE